MSARPLAGVVPVLPTPFGSDGAADAVALRRLVRYLLRCGVDGIAYPGVASEVSRLSEHERQAGLAAVLDEVRGRVPVVAGISSADADLTLRLARSAAHAGAAVLMVAARAGAADEQRAYFAAVAQAASGVPLMLQNLPAPTGADLEPAQVLDLVLAVPQIRYVKEESVPSGQRLGALRAGAPAHLQGLFGGAGGRYIVGELQRGACGTMPAIELAEVHVALFEAHRRGDALAVRHLFQRMLPLLNLQAVYRWALTKEVLSQRGLLAHAGQREPGPRLDGVDAAEVACLLHDLRDLLLDAPALQALA